MKPADLRNATFADLQGVLTSRRLQVLAAWKAHGPCTTQRLALQAELSVLSIRPRTTELVQLGLVKLVDRQGHEGVYAALGEEEAMLLFGERQEAAKRRECQPELKLTERETSRQGEGETARR